MVGSISNFSDIHAGETISFLFGAIFPAVVGPIGVIGNTICIVVLSKVIYWGGRCPLFLILIALAASDSIFLILNLVLNSLGSLYDYKIWTAFFIFRQYQGSIVVYSWPLAMISQTVSIYLTVLVSYERWRAVCRPLHAKKRCSMRRITIIILLICLGSLLYNFPKWWEFYDYEENYSDDNFSNVTVRKWDKTNLGNNVYFKYIYSATSYAVVMFIFPFIIITWFNAALVHSLSKNRRRWQEISRTQKREVKLTYVPLAIAGLFYLFGMPALVANLLDSVRGTFIHIPESTYNSIVTVGNFFVLFNSAINFVIYCLLGEKFRDTLAKICGCGRRIQRRGWQTDTVSDGRQLSLLGSHSKHSQEVRKRKTTDID